MSLRLKDMRELTKNWAPCFTIIKSLLSPEIEARIKELPGYVNAVGSYDPSKAELDHEAQVATARHRRNESSWRYNIH